MAEEFSDEELEELEDDSQLDDGEFPGEDDDPPWDDLYDEKRDDLDLYDDDYCCGCPCSPGCDKESDCCVCHAMP